MEITGKIIAALEKRSGVSQKTGKEWSTQEFVLETHDQYPRKVCFEVFGDERIKQFNISVGEERTIHFDVDAREWTTKDGQTRWTNTIRAYRCYKPSDQAQEQQADATSAAPAVAPAAPAPTYEQAPAEDFSGMPF